MALDFLFRARARVRVRASHVKWAVSDATQQIHDTDINYAEKVFTCTSESFSPSFLLSKVLLILECSQ